MPETPMETWFGKDLRRRETLPDVSCFAGSRPVTWDGLRPGPDQALAPQAVPASGAWRGWSVSGPAPDAPAGAGKRDAWLHQFRARQAAAAACVLLQGARGAGQTDTAALLAIQRTSRFRGSAWVAFGTEHVDLTHPTAKLLRDAVVAAARLVTQGIAFDPLQPEFRIQDGKVVMDVFLTGRCFGAAPRKIALQATVRSGARDAWPRHTRHIELQPGSWPRLRWLEAVPVETFDPQCFEVSVVPVAADLATVGSAVFALDAKQALRDVGDFLVQAGLDDRKYHGFAFIDNRAARGLLGAFEILGDERYRQSALAWGQAMLDEQREDGGYRMGYGITSRGEECYVADGGEIAVGMARLVSYTDRPRREQYLDSLRRYMAYRDSFRVPEGGIGVGWCLSDYGARPIVPLETPTKIFAPEINTYTIGCSLAAAYALARLRGEPDLERAAERDADWLMPRTKSLHGAYCESFVYAHAFTSDAARRELYATYLLEHFVAPILANKPGWWTWGAGRSALNLDGLVYCHERLGQTPELQRAILEAASAMFAPQGSDSLYTLVRGEPPRQRSDALLYLCYSYLSLADLVRPMVTMDKFVPGP
jgi:hypothetical protein